MHCSKNSDSPPDASGHDLYSRLVNLPSCGFFFPPSSVLTHIFLLAAAECEKLGGRALAVRVNVLDEKTIEEAMEKCVATFGGIDV